MLTALAINDVRPSDTIFCASRSSIMPNAVGEGGERAAPSLVPLTHRHGSKRSSSPIALHPESGAAASSSSLLLGDVTRTPPQRQSTQPRATSASQQEAAAAAADVNGSNASPSSSSGVAAEAATATIVASATAHSTHDGSGAVAGNTATTGSSSGTTGSGHVAAAGCRTPKRAQKITTGQHAHRRGSTATSTSSAAALRTASERCKAARTLAAELMSALMERPPQASQIAHYRQSRLAPSSAAATTPLPLTAGTTSVTGTPQREVHAEALHKDCTAASVPQGLTVTGSDATATSSPPAPSLSTPSFLEAVRKGRNKSTTHATTTTTTTTSPAQPLKAGGTPPQGSAGHHGSGPRSPSPALPLPPAHTGESHSRRHLELIPEDAAATPQLLSALREVSLACGTLDSLSRPSTAPGGGQPSAPPSNGGGGGSTTSQHEVADVNEAQWQRVRTHLQVVCGLVLNAPELASVLDDALGADWRSTSDTTPQQHSDPSQACTPLPAAAVEAACGSDAVVPVMPTPVDHDGPSQAAARANTAAAAAGAAGGGTSAGSAGNGSGSGGGGGASTRTATVTTTTTITTTTTTTTTSTTTAAATLSASTLNHNARPFHSRTPPSFPQPMGTSNNGSAAPQSGNGASPALHSSSLTRSSITSAVASPAAAAAVASAAAVAATSMKQLSESSSTYSPSQHVTTFLERSTPPASGRLVEESDPGLLNFPSTPLSEAAVPYQPSAPLVGSTSPRGGAGGNTSASSNTPFHLESREEMLRRRSAAPNAFYASMTHSGATHYLGGPPSAATTPGTFVPSSVPQGPTPFLLTGSGARSMPVSPILSYGSPVSGAVCPYDYILVLDFEATCEEHPPPNYLYEIIEFPVVVVDVRLQRVVAEFHRFVRPRHKVELSGFCRELTGMRQEDVNAAAPLEEVIVQFERWFAHTVPPQARCVFATDGPMDMREFMYYHSVSRQGIRFPPLFYQYIDVKQTFACFFQCAQGKIKAMLEVLHVPFEGRLHSGLDDARNIAAIVIGLLQYGSTLCEVPLNRLPLNGLLLSGGSAMGGGGGGGSHSTPLSLPPSTAAAGSGRHRHSASSPTYITAPYSVDEDDYSY